MEKRVMTFNVNDTTRDCLLFVDDKSFSIYKFNSDKWESRYQGEIDFADFDFKHLLSGDIDNDNDDELLLLSNNTVTIYSFADGHFTRVAYDFPHYPEDALIGDIDNDSLNELVMLCADEPETNDRFNTIYNLCIYNCDGRGLDLVWSDNGSLKLSSDNAVVPPQQLMCIADIDNTGHNKLIMPGIKSDTSPTYFIVHSWHNNTLIRYKTFRITELSDTLITSGFNKSLRKPDRSSKLSREEITKFKRENRLQRHVFHDVKPGKLKGETYLLTDIIDKRVIPVIIKIIDNKITMNRLDDLMINSGGLKWLNIDGQGTGLLDLYYPDNSDIARFKFYR